MAEQITLARPYAQAIFDIAQQESDLQGWSDRLERLAAIVGQDAIQSMIGDPRVGKERLADLIIEICGSDISDKGKNLVRLLTTNGRINVVPEISELFTQLKADAESTLQAEVVSATPLSADQQEKVASALKRRLGRDVTVTTREDPSLVGGAIIRAGDLVIDGSVRQQLHQLANALTH